MSADDLAWFHRLLESARADTALSKLTDDQLADLVLEKIWANLKSTSTLAVVLEQVIDRLRRAKGGPLR